MTASIFTSLLHGATKHTGVTNSAVLSGGEGVNMLPGTTFDYWLPTSLITSAQAVFDVGSAVVVNYFAFDVHNLDTIDCDHIQLHASNDSGFSGAVNLGSILKANIVPGANIKRFSNSTAYRYYRVFVEETSTFTDDPIIGVFYAGLALDLPNGIRPSYTPPRMGLVSEVLNHTSDGGNFIGRSLKRSHYDFVIKNDYITKTWIDANWQDLVDYIQVKPFFYLWNDLYTDEAVFCWTAGKIPPPRYAYQAWLSFEFRCNGFV